MNSRKNSLKIKNKLKFISYFVRIENSEKLKIFFLIFTIFFIFENYFSDFLILKLI